MDQSFSWQNLISKWLGKKLDISYNLGILLLAGLAWTLWSARNKMTLRGSLLNKATDIMFAAVATLQRWGILRLKEDKLKVDLVVKTLMDRTKALKPSKENVSDIKAFC